MDASEYREVKALQLELKRLRQHIERNDNTHHEIVAKVLDITNFNQRKIAEFNRASTRFVRLSFLISGSAVFLSLPHAVHNSFLIIIKSVWQFIVR